MIYQVSTGYLDPSSITYPFRNLFRNRANFRFRMGELQEIIPDENVIVLDNGQLHYDHLVMATGTHTNFFGLDQLQKFAIPMKTLEDGLQMRNRLLQHLEQATQIDDKSLRMPWLNMVVAGGGPTGVEICGILQNCAIIPSVKNFPNCSILEHGSI